MTTWYLGLPTLSEREVHGGKNEWLFLLSSEADLHEAAALCCCRRTLSMTTGDLRKGSMVILIGFKSEQPPTNIQSDNKEQ